LCSGINFLFGITIHSINTGEQVKVEVAGKMAGITCC